MQLPIDIKALIDETTNIKTARETQVSLSLYFDMAAPNDLVAHMRNSFASASSSVRMVMSYLDGSFVPRSGDDFAIIVAGGSAVVGPAAAAIRGMGVPVMVVTKQPEAVKAAAAAGGYSIPEGDVVAPAQAEAADLVDELDDEALADLDERMGNWIVSVSREKRLAMAIAFPFMRRALAKDSVQATSLQNAGIGLVPLIAGADLPVMTLNQAKMVLQIAAAYGQEMDKNRAKELACVVGGAYFCRVVARELIELVPVLGFAIRPAVAYGGTSAVGYAAIEYFEGGQDAAGVMNVATKATEVGTKVVNKVRSEGWNLVPEILDKAQDKAKGLADYIPVAMDKVQEYAPKVKSVVNDLADSFVSQANADGKSA